MHPGEAAAVRSRLTVKPNASIADVTDTILYAPAGRVSAALGLRPSSLIPACLILLLALSSRATALPAAEANRLTKLAPESVVVQLENGFGAADLIFVLADGAAVPSYRVTAAVGSANTIPAEHITFKWVAPPQAQQTAGRTHLVGQLSVEARVNVERGTNYTGRIIFYWPDAEQSVDFTVSDRTALAFSLLTPRLDLTLSQFQPDKMSIRVKNTGKTNIRKLTLSSSDLRDGETQRRISLPEVVKDLDAAPLAPEQEAEVSLDIPRPVWAGSYTGTLDVVADGRSRQSIPLVILSRGPVPTAKSYFVPVILFGATLLLGYVLSTKLENWFNLGGLQRAEALLSLQRSERELARVSDQVDDWGANRPARVFARTKIWLRQHLNDLRGLFAKIQDLSREQLVSEAQRFATATTQAGIFESAVEVALSQWPDPSQEQKLNRVLEELDRITPASDPQTYRDSLRAVLERVASEGDAESETSAFDAGRALPDIPPPADLRRRIERMARLQRMVVAVVVFIVAYQLFYARDFTFGTLLDYLGVFLWSLGLTQTGTQILARARSSYTPSQ